MSKRLQVVVPDSELKSFQQAARRRGLTLSEWVRQVLSRAERELADHGSQAKIQAIRSAARHSFPVSDIEEMLAEIEQGYGSVQEEP